MALDRQKILQKLIKDFDPIIANYLDSKEKPEVEKEDSELEDCEDDEEKKSVMVAKLSK